MSAQRQTVPNYDISIFRTRCDVSAFRVLELRSVTDVTDVITVAFEFIRAVFVHVSNFYSVYLSISVAPYHSFGIKGETDCHNPTGGLQCLHGQFGLHAVYFASVVAGP